MRCRGVWLLLLGAWIGSFLASRALALVYEGSGRLEPSGVPVDIEVVGSLAYVADRDLGLRIVDVSDPDVFVELGAYSPGVPLGAVAVDGGTAYLFATVYGESASEGLYVVNVQDPTHPVEIGFLALPNHLAHQIVVSGDIAYLADRGGLQLADVSDPTTPTLAGSIATADDASAMAVVGDLVYVAAGTAGLRVIDASNPAAPVDVGGIDAASLFRVYGLAVTGTVACVVGSKHLALVDVSDPTNPVPLGEMAAPLGSQVEIVGGLAFVNGLWVADISDPTAPTYLGSLETAGGVKRIAIAGDRVFSTDSIRGIRRIDASHPSGVREVGSLSFSYWEYWTPNLYIEDGIALVGLGEDASGSGPLALIDVSDPAAMSELGSIGLGYVTQVARSGPLAFVTAGWGGLKVVDVSDPTAPALITSYQLDPRDSALGIAVADEIAYVSWQNADLVLLDVSDPAAPVKLGSLGTPGPVYDIEVVGDVAYLAAGDLWVVDVSKPTAPRTLQILATPGLAKGIVVFQDLAYLADGDSIRVLDISDPTSPVEIQVIDLEAEVYQLALDPAGALLYFPQAHDDFEAIGATDVSNLATARLLAAHRLPSTPAYSKRVAVSGGYAFVMSQEGLRAYDFASTFSPSVENLPASSAPALLALLLLLAGLGIRTCRPS